MKQLVASTSKQELPTNEMTCGIYGYIGALYKQKDQ